MPRLSSRFCLVVLGALLLLPIQLAPAATSQDSAPAAYIVVLNDSVANPASVAAAHANRVDAAPGHVYKHALKGYSAVLSAAAVAALRKDARVKSIELDRRVTASTTQTGATWGLDRIDQRSRPTDGDVHVLQHRLRRHGVHHRHRDPVLATRSSAAARSAGSTPSTAAAPTTATATAHTSPGRPAARPTASPRASRSWRSACSTAAAAARPPASSPGSTGSPATTRRAPPPLRT